MAAYLSVAGNIGSGKTTVSRLICEQLKFSYVHSDRPAQSYLADLLGAPSRWAFECQIAFLADKVAAIREGLKSGKDFLADRSVYEDMAVFAKLFYENESLDARSYITYCEVASLLTTDLPTPSAMVYCQASATQCGRRLTDRGRRGFEMAYTDAYVTHLDTLYGEWISRFDQCPVYILNTDVFDVRIESVGSIVCSDLAFALASPQHRLQILAAWHGSRQCPANVKPGSLICG
jgi:deoxyadenosine/deoxycytidine kinase